MRQFWDMLYRDRVSRIMFAVGLTGFLGNFLLDIWPQEHPHYALRDWVVLACSYWSGVLIILSTRAAIRVWGQRAQKPSIERN